MRNSGVLCHWHRRTHFHFGADLRYRKIDDGRIIELIREHFDLKPKGLIAMLDLLRPIYKDTAAYGHFGRDEANFSWEKTDKADALKDAAGL